MADKANPHARQNRLPGVIGSPHDGHPPARAPQSPQNRSPSSKAAPHCPHRTQISYVRLVSAVNRDLYSGATGRGEHRDLPPGPGQGGG
jgi:hypothetical protein